MKELYEFTQNDISKLIADHMASRLGKNKIPVSVTIQLIWKRNEVEEIKAIAEITE